MADNDYYCRSFNPCFNGSMYKNFSKKLSRITKIMCFNPCFNGSMYKNLPAVQYRVQAPPVSILVLMDLCIKTAIAVPTFLKPAGFNPCFNGSMYKNLLLMQSSEQSKRVSILVLMDLCIKTFSLSNSSIITSVFQSLF